MNQVILEYRNKDLRCIEIAIALLNSEVDFISKYGEKVYNDVRKIELKFGSLKGFIDYAISTTADNYVSSVVIDGNNIDAWIVKQIRKINRTNTH